MKEDFNSNREGIKVFEKWQEHFEPIKRHQTDTHLKHDEGGSRVKELELTI